MGEMVWGNSGEVPYNTVKRQVQNNAEIGKGNYLYITTPTQGFASIPLTDWAGITSGIGDIFRGQIQQQISGARLVWTKISWSAAYPNPISLAFVIVTDLKMEALVKNENAGLTGLEVVAVIGAIAILATFVALIAVGAWVTYEVMTAATDLGSGATVGVGLLILLGVGALLFFLFGGSFSKGKKGFRVQGRR